MTPEPGPSLRGPAPPTLGKGWGRRLKEWWTGADRNRETIARQADSNVCREAGIRQHLDEAWDATLDNGPRRRLKEWWTGGAIERSWAHLHAAKALLAPLHEPLTLASRVPGVIALAKQALPKADPRLEAIEDRLGKAGWEAATDDQKRANYQGALHWAYEASDTYYQQVRSFRNLVMAATVGLFVLSVGLALLGWSRPTWLPLCFAPQPETTGAGGAVATTQDACPAGGERPARADVALVELLGLVGGGVAASLAIRGIRGTTTPYGVPIALAVLKLPFGALAAVLAILLLRAEFVPGLSALDSQNQILAYAVLFGYAQQLATKLIDRQGQTVLDKVPVAEPPTPPKQDAHRKESLQ